MVLYSNEYLKKKKEKAILQVESKELRLSWQ